MNGRWSLPLYLCLVDPARRQAVLTLNEAADESGSGRKEPVYPEK